MKEEQILEFKVEQGDAISELEQTKIAILGLKKEQKELNDSYKKGTVSTQEYAKQSVRLEGELKKQTTAFNSNLKAANGVTTQFDKLVGSLDKMVPGLGGVTSGFQGITKGALAFIATPIGAVIGALGLALGALVSYFKGSEEGQTQFNKVVNVGSAILGKFGDLVQFVGKFLFENLAKGFEKVIGFLNKWVPGFQAATEALSDFLNLNVADNISALEEQQVQLNRLLIVERGRLRNEIEAAKLRAESTKDAKERAAALADVTKFTNELFDKELKLAELERDIAIEKGNLANNTIEDNDKIAESIAKVDDIERQRSAALKENATKELALREQDKALREKERQEREKAEAEQEEIDRARRIRVNEEQYQDEVVQKERILELENNNANKSLENTAKILKAKIDADKKTSDAKKKATQEEILLDNLKTQAALQNAANVINIGSQLLKEGSAGAKAAAIAVTTAQTISAATAALAPPPVGVGPVLGPILAAITVATGLANVAKISGLSFAAGGGSFMTKGPTALVVGDNPGGVERVDVTPISGRGRTVVGNGMIKMAGGGSIIANAESSRIDSRLSMANSFKGMKIYTSWTEGREVGNQVEFKESITTA